jgi:hypothetical protein
MTSTHHNFEHNCIFYFRRYQEKEGKGKEFWGYEKREEN